MSDEIDDMLDEINETDVEEKKNNEIDATDKEELANQLLDMTKDDRNMADKIFQLFYPELGTGRDRSQASKEAITRALELKINAGRNIIELMKLLKEDTKSGNIGIFFGEKKAGIDINNIRDEIDD